MIGLLVKGLQEEEYLVTCESEAGDGQQSFRVFLRETQGWALVELAADEQARLHAEVMIGIYKMARQFGVGVPWPPQGLNPDASGQ